MSHFDQDELVDLHPQEKLMELTIDSMKRDKTAFRVGDKWYNQDKKALPDFSALDAGNKVEVSEADAASGWIKSIKVLDATKKTFGAPAKTYGGGGFKKAENTPEKDAMIARHTAVKAVLESPVVVQLLDKNADEAEQEAAVREMIADYTAYILTGKF